MQPNHHWQDQTIARFLHLSRLHLGLQQAPTALRPPHRKARSARHIIRSLIVAGSLGALFGGPAFACEGSRPADPNKRSNNPHSTRAKADDGQHQSTGPALSAKNR